jgi:hypothetical protein
MRLHQLDPTKDSRWAELVGRHPKASIFHTVSWLKALQNTYGYQPVVFTTSSPASELENGVAFCGVKSWLTGRRLVSLPFSDHCEPLCDSAEDLTFLILSLQTQLEIQGWKYIEVRPIDWNFDQLNDGVDLRPVENYFLHTLDLRPDLDQVFGMLDKDCVQRRIHHAERAGLMEKCGRSKELLNEFYDLFVITRSRHQLPPMSYTWFLNLIRGQGNALEIRVAYKQQTPVAAVLTLRFRDVLYFKYGCSDARFHKLGATSWLLWRAIAAGKTSGALKFDMGRTEAENVGLLAFKNHWVEQPKLMVYWKFPDTSSFDSLNGWKLNMAKRVFSLMPDKLLRITGQFIYPHIG